MSGCYVSPKVRKPKEHNTHGSKWASLQNLIKNGTFVNYDHKMPDISKRHISNNQHTRQADDGSCRPLRRITPPCGEIGSLSRTWPSLLETFMCGASLQKDHVPYPGLFEYKMATVGPCPDIDKLERLASLGYTASETCFDLTKHVYSVLSRIYKG
jgi:hypothetical protein